MAALLKTYLESCARERFVLGEEHGDCAQLVSGWLKLARGIDPGEAFRGRYSDAKQVRRLVKGEGGFVPLIGCLLDEAGLERTQDARDGDVAIVDIPMRYRYAVPIVRASMAIRCGRFWITRAMIGVVGAADFMPVSVWRVL